MFTFEDGRPPHPDTIRQRFDRLAAAGLSRITFHLRHSHATGALKAGVSPKLGSERVGHADVGFFLQTYAHVLKNDDRDAAEQAASFLIRPDWDSEPDDEPGCQPDSLTSCFAVNGSVDTLENRFGWQREHERSAGWRAIIRCDGQSLSDREDQGEKGDEGRTTRVKAVSMTAFIRLDGLAQPRPDAAGKRRVIQAEGEVTNGVGGKAPSALS